MPEQLEAWDERLVDLGARLQGPSGTPRRPRLAEQASAFHERVCAGESARGSST